MFYMVYNPVSASLTQENIFGYTFEVLNVRFEF